MAMIDYGAILKKNGKIQNRDEFFMDMEAAVGWTDNPHIKYEDCDCIDEFGYSNCENCPHAHFTHRSHPELGEWDSYDSDCRGNRPNGNSIGGNWFVYAGDTDFVVVTGRKI